MIDSLAHDVMRVLGRPLTDTELCRSIASVAGEHILPVLTQLTKERDELKAWKEYAQGHGLFIGTNKTSDCPEGRLAHTYTKGSSLARMFDEWSDSIGHVEREAQLTTRAETAERELHIRNQELKDTCAKLDAARAELKEANILRFKDAEWINSLRSELATLKDQLGETQREAQQKLDTLGTWNASLIASNTTLQTKADALADCLYSAIKAGEILDADQFSNHLLADMRRSYSAYRNPEAKDKA